MQSLLSIIILTKNEERDLPGCLDSIKWCSDIHVVDCGSCDATVTIATEFGAKCYEHEFRSFGEQRNWGLHNCVLQNDWVLFLDADERSCAAFHKALYRAITDVDESIAGFYCCWKMMLCNTWLKRCDSFPKWQFRVLRIGRAQFTDYGHGQKESCVQGRIGYIEEPYLHYAFSKGWRQWLARHNTYSDQEARERLQVRYRWQDIFSRHGSVRNSALKPLLSSWKLWPLLRFVWMYCCKLGFLEGRAGFIYCVNMAYYEFLIQIKMEEMQHSWA